MAKRNLKLQLLVYFAALAYLFGSSYTIFVNHDASFSSDEQSYLRMAKGDYHVATTHRYRVVVPVLASTVAHGIGSIAQIGATSADNPKLPFGSSFFVVNAIIMGWVGLFIFLTCRLYGSSPFASFIGMTAILTSAYSSYFTGIALTDSLYLLIFALTLYGVKAGSAPAILFCIFLGPLAKESFIFLAPIILLYGHRAIPRQYQIPLFLLAGLITFGIRHLIDLQIGFSAEGGITNALNHIQNIGPTLRRLLTISGLLSLWSTFGFFYLLLPIGFYGGGEARRTWLKHLDVPSLLLVVVVLVHIPLSGEIGRMAFFAAPVFAVVISLILTFHPLWVWWMGQHTQLVKESQIRKNG